MTNLSQLIYHLYQLDSMATIQGLMIPNNNPTIVESIIELCSIGHHRYKNSSVDDDFPIHQHHFGHSFSIVKCMLSRFNTLKIWQYNCFMNQFNWTENSDVITTCFKGSIWLPPSATPPPLPSKDTKISK